MAIRPENHITGDKAIRKISDRLIPEEWTISIPDSDYGLDMLIEVVKDNSTTGSFFFIQSKGTLEHSINGSITYSIDVTKLKDYSSIKLPVLFVLYSKSDNKFWGRWMNAMYETLSDVQKSQKTATLHFNDKNEIDQDYLLSIGDSIEISLTNRISIVGQQVPALYERIHNQTINIAKQLIGLDITEDNCLTCKSIEITYNGTLEDGLAIICKDNLKINIPVKLESRDVLYYPFISREECPICLLDLSYVIAMLGSQLSEKCLDYTLTFIDERVINYIPNDICIEFIYCLPIEKLPQLYNFFKVAVQVNRNEIVQAILMQVFLCSIKRNDFKTLYKDLIRYYLTYGDENAPKGNFLYNLANSMREESCHEAFFLYMKALKYEPTYKDRYYWWQEVAGVLYITEHYIFATNFYRKSRDLNPQLCRQDIDILISDCLVCQGRLFEAQVEEKHYIDTHEKISASISLKMIITDMMTSQNVDKFDRIYWYNLGITASQKNNFSEALSCFLFSWRLYDGDVEALAIAFIQAFNVYEMNMALLILMVIRECYPEQGYKYLVSIILSNGLNESSEVMIDFIQMVLYQKDTNTNIV